MLRVLEKIWGFTENWMEKRVIKRTGGIPVVYIIYKPWEDAPNVIFMLHPEIREDALMNEYAKKLADRVREIYPRQDLKDFKDKYK